MDFIKHIRPEVHKIYRGVPEVFQDDFALGLVGKRLPFLVYDNSVLDEVEPFVYAHLAEPTGMHSPNFLLMTVTYGKAPSSTLPTTT
jgi:hypothetical protein